MPRPLSLPRFIAVAALGLSTVVSASAQVAYPNAAAAYAAGQKQLAAGNLAAAQAPLEAALKLATDDATKLMVNRALLIPYRELPDVGPMKATAEAVIAMSDRPAERSLTRGAMLAFAHKRGKMDAVVAGYEDRLKAAPDDRTLLFILTEAHSQYTKNAARSAELGERLAALDRKAGVPPDVRERAKVAGAYVKAAKFKEGAELYEAIAPLDQALEAWHLKEAAQAWLKAGDKAKALAAARNAGTAAPEKRGDLLVYFWHRGLGDVLLDAGAPKEAVPHFEKALATTKIEGYAKDTQKRLDAARAAAGK